MRNYGTPGEVLRSMLVHSIAIKRKNVTLAPQPVYVVAVSEGFSTNLSTVAIYGGPDLDIDVEDTFRHNGGPSFERAGAGAFWYVVKWVSPIQWAPLDGGTLRTAWAEALPRRA